MENISILERRDAIRDVMPQGTANRRQQGGKGKGTGHYGYGTAETRGRGRDGASCMHAGELTPSFPLRTWRHPATPSFGWACLRAVISHGCYCQWREREREREGERESDGYPLQKRAPRMHTLALGCTSIALGRIHGQFHLRAMEADRGSQPEQCLNGGRNKGTSAHGSWPRCRAGSTRPVRPAVSSLRASLPSYNDIADG